MYASQDAQLKAITVISNPESFVNGNDRDSLLRMLAGMRMHRVPTAMSALAIPTVAATIKSTEGTDASASRAMEQLHSQFGSLNHLPLPRPEEQDDKQEASYTRDPLISHQLAHAIRFAHRRYRSAPALAKPRAQSRVVPGGAASTPAVQRRLQARYPLFQAAKLYEAQQRLDQSSAAQAASEVELAEEDSPSPSPQIATRSAPRERPKFLQRSATTKLDL